MDVYYNPGNFGLEIVKEIDTAGDYEFEMVVVWKDKDGNHYLAADSGCSCPSPFEEYTAIEQLTRFDEHSLQVVEDALKNADADYDRAKSFMETVKKSLKGGD